MYEPMYVSCIHNNPLKTLSILNYEDASTSKFSTPLATSVVGVAAPEVPLPFSVGVAVPASAPPLFFFFFFFLF